MFLRDTTVTVYSTQYARPRQRLACKREVAGGGRSQPLSCRVAVCNAVPVQYLFRLSHGALETLKSRAVQRKQDLLVCMVWIFLHQGPTGCVAFCPRTRGIVIARRCILDKCNVQSISMSRLLRKCGDFVGSNRRRRSVVGL